MGKSTKASAAAKNVRIHNVTTKFSRIAVILFQRLHGKERERERIVGVIDWIVWVCVKKSSEERGGVGMKK